MKRLRISRPSPSIIITCVAMFAALGGTSYAAGIGMNSGSPTHSHNSSMGASSHSGGAWASHLGGLPASAYLLSKRYVSSRGVHFLKAGQTNVVLGKAGHFTFLGSCQQVTDPMTSNQEDQATFTVVANTYASLDGNKPVPAETVDNPPIHQDSDSLDSTSSNPLTDGDYAQTPSASTSTEIAADGQEADIFYVDGVNWPGGSGSPGHACFAGYNGFLTGGSSGEGSINAGSHF